ncbi:MAG: ferredoxin--NADP reductase [Planctomycetes bacterium]|jgi:ferredoxin--NADP+ reductase|nr:ferredoxin--NADP reductase [Planctomycetota bacterium]
MDAPAAESLNAAVTKRVDLAPGLLILRVVPDGPLFPFEAGQFCVLGLPPEAPRVTEAAVEDAEKKRTRMIRRSYSIASSSREREYLEFYVSLVHSGELTPRLFALREGDRLWLGPKATGLFTMKQVPGEADLFLLSTGTGLAPYVSMIRSDLLDRARGRRIVVAHGARHSFDLGYRGEFEDLAKRFGNLRYLPSITRPAEDPSFCGETGYLQDQLADGRIEARAEVALSPATSHVFLCGNPAMIEACLAILHARGFREWSKKDPGGQVHLEKYW